MDSIRQALNNENGFDNLVNKIRLIINADLLNEHVIVLVEGLDDKKFVDNIFEGHIICFESFSGKSGLYELIECKEIADNRIIAIRDRDYSDPKEYPDRMFCYDYCSLELMLLHNNFIIDRMKKHCCSDAYRENFPISIMRHIVMFSILRKYNEERSLGISLSKGVLSGCNSTELLPDMNELFQRNKIENQLIDECKKNSLEILDEDLWDITNGHDLCAVLGKISTLCGKRALGEDGYRSMIISMYRKEDFYNTQLYEDLIEYQKKEGIIIF